MPRPKTRPGKKRRPRTERRVQSARRAELEGGEGEDARRADAAWLDAGDRAADQLDEEALEAAIGGAFDQFDRERAGTVESNELMALCASLDCMLTAQELNDALDALDPQSTGAIARARFVDWWLGRGDVMADVEGEIAAGAGASADEPPLASGSAAKAARRLRKQSAGAGGNNSGLLAAKMARRQAEGDAQLLQNRIALLQLEEARAWKKIQQTKARAKEILALRDETARRHTARAATPGGGGAHGGGGGGGAGGEPAVSEAVLRRRQEDKARSRARRLQAAEAVTRKKREEVREVQRMRRRHEEEKLQARRQQIQKAIESRMRIKAQEKAAARARARAERRRRKQNQKEYRKRVSEQKKATQRKIDEVARLERAEMELIQRLQNAQLMQKEAYSHLEGALSGRLGTAQGPGPRMSASEVGGSSSVFDG